MATLFQYLNTGDTGSYSFYGVNWKAMTFTVVTAHIITSVKLLLYRHGLPGTLTVSIRATDGSGHPTGDDLCSGTTDGNTLTTSSSGEWREISFGAGALLSASTKYAIVIRGGTSDTNCAYWRRAPNLYATGNSEWSSNSGDSWTANTSYDLMFEDWGELPVVLASASGSGIGSAETIGCLLFEGTALGSGIGTAQGTPVVIVIADALGSGIGLSEATAYLIILALASGEGVGTLALDASLIPYEYWYLIQEAPALRARIIELEAALEPKALFRI